MFINQTVTKKVLEAIVHETFINFGNLTSSSLLDALKLLGFYYATNAGISINIEDLKTPDIKKKYLLDANKETELVSQQWKNGLVSDNERFQTIIDSWNIATESLKNRIIDYYQNFDPVNNLYIMAFSGARGNMSQVRQLVGMRGLMSDQEGKIIDLPIQTNFREGLSSIDYIISSYGARKGIVDTALKTADSGYLTRRLIYVAQDLVIREFDCQTKKGLLILLKKKTSSQNFIGRSVLSIKKLQYPFQEILEKEQILDVNTFKKIQKLAPITLNLRSSLTCKSNGSICQICYGWDLAHKKLISLGEVVGILAAQSIGEPGTQLTMRTFHTGGIFTSETLKQVVAPFSGKIVLPSDLKATPIRTNHGISVLKLQQEIKLKIVNWRGIEEIIELDIGSFLYFQNSGFLQKGQLIAEYSTQSILPGPRKSKPIYSSLSGEIKFENITLKKKVDETKRVTKNEGVLWIASGSLFSLPKEGKFNYPKNLNKQKALISLKISTVDEGIIIFENNALILLNPLNKKVLNLLTLFPSLKNCTIKIIPIVKNYQYVDPYTIVAFLYVYPVENEKVLKIREQLVIESNSPDSMVSISQERNDSTDLKILIIREKDTWSISSDQVSNLFFAKENKLFVRYGQELSLTSTFTHSGLFLEKSGFQFLFQHATPIFLNPNSAIYSSSGDFVDKKELIATLIKYTQQTEDIVQGLPKIEELIEARKPRNACALAKQPGVVLNVSQLVRCNFLDECIKIQIKDRTSLQIKELKDLENDKKKGKKGESKQEYFMGQKLSFNEKFVFFENSLFKINYILPFSSDLFVIDSLRKKTFLCKLQLGGTSKKQSWLKEEKIILNEEESHLYLYKNNEKIKWNQLLLVPRKEKDFFSTIYISDNRRFFVIQTNDKKFVFLEHIDSSIQLYQVPLKSQLRYQPGIFVDLGEPINDGMTDVHNLLKVLFLYHRKLDGILKGTLKSLTKFQLLLVNSIQAIYQSQGVNISSKHIEIIVRQMTSKVLIVESGDTPLLPGELVSLSLMTEILLALQSENQNCRKRIYQTPEYEPKLRSATNSSLNKDGFLSSAGFQETRRVLTKAAINGTNDWLRGLKESLITGRIIPAGSSFLNYKNYLNSIYEFKN